MTQFSLHGIVPPVVTPLTTDMEVDAPSLRRVVRHLIDGGVHGLFILGSSSEVVFLDAQRRAEVIRIVMEEAGGRVPVIAGVIDIATDRCIQHAREARALGVDALVLTAPFYTRTSQAEIVDHFCYVRDAVDLPLIAYDIPVCVNIKLERETLHKLYARKAIVGLKDSSGDDGNMRMVMRDFAAHPDFAVLTGSEITVDYALLGGGHGAVPGLANVDPAGYVRLYDAARKGDWVAARAEQQRLIELFEIVFQGYPDTSRNASGVGGFKTAMQMMGLITHRHMSRPNAVLSDAHAAKVRAIVEKSGLLRAG
ncbi:dihydrodipicolinate synthase family protein [Paraburkholderia unamae]|uniref:4-hydroxy-tetrahydrodipicolinate synthase n=1 Tax=Paraburkholderia unamae TaxID=219649 RepID=A0ABX5KKE1_9BURK|nr:dihydrodipicolinate synthase family protein [Paraburkholderia unamae]PVX81145.1 4-hydroxy-tetrahydrodipicolinate synthase [Paraburkholderia unamae]